MEEEDESYIQSCMYRIDFRLNFIAIYHEICLIISIKLDMYVQVGIYKQRHMVFNIGQKRPYLGTIGIHTG
jgi:hypothetical protein